LAAFAALGRQANKAAYVQAIEYINSLPLKDIEFFHEQMPDPFNPCATCTNCRCYDWYMCTSCTTKGNIKTSLGMIIDQITIPQPTTYDACK